MVAGELARENIAGRGEVCGPDLTIAYGYGQVFGVRGCDPFLMIALHMGRSLISGAMIPKKLSIIG